MWPCERLDSVDSTQLELQRRLKAMQGPAAVWTTCQTAGRGAHGRTWRDSQDGLALSAAWPVGEASAQALAWPARLSLMTLQVLEHLYPEAKDRLSVKWPNDVMSGHGKLCGVLVSQHRSGSGTWLIAGIGVNLSWPESPSLDRPVADLRRLGIVADPEAIAHGLCKAMELLSSHPFDSRWAAEFSRRDVFLGREVAIVHPHRAEVLHTGLHQGVDAQGRLLLFSEARVVPVQIGELSLRSMEQVR